MVVRLGNIVEVESAEDGHSVYLLVISIILPDYSYDPYTFEGIEVKISPPNALPSSITATEKVVNISLISIKRVVSTMDFKNLEARKIWSWIWVNLYDIFRTEFSHKTYFFCLFKALNFSIIQKV